jgi:hypothetical protein
MMLRQIDETRTVLKPSFEEMYGRKRVLFATVHTRPRILRYQTDPLACSPPVPI